MYGSWQSHRPGRPWRRRKRQADILLVTERSPFPCFNARDTEIMRSEGFRYRDARQLLGPDLIGDAREFDGLPVRARRLGGTTDQDLAGLYRRAADLLGKNLVGGPRATRRVSDGRSDLRAHRRRGLPCLRCGASVEETKADEGVGSPIAHMTRFIFLPCAMGDLTP